MDNYTEIGARLRELREVSDYSIEELAAELNLTPEVYASYEENGKDVPISVIYEIAQKFKVDFAEIITGNTAWLDTYQLIRRGGGKETNRNPEYHFEDLAYRYGNKIMQPLLVTLDPSDTPAKLISHRGQEFNLVLHGHHHAGHQGDHHESRRFHLFQPDDPPRPALRLRRESPLSDRHRRISAKKEDTHFELSAEQISATDRVFEL